ncbi:hypothetical protein [Luteibacter sp. SG786]|uniref:hypothetical protein n=1 Tax=Luteibacter sp. SG786 TaxID=2587130 RepID=UPI00141F1C90|nr:hypothetical protein [Luteibacter sp. SG786]NII52737.1 hypothetical protein [Luteibacter sp. SG786]
MAELPIRFVAFAAILVTTTLARAGDIEPVRYDLAFRRQGAALETVEVRATARLNRDGVIDFAVPSWQVTDVHALAGSLDTSTPGRWRLRGQPGSEVAFAWRSQPAALTRILPWDVSQSVLVRPDAIAASTNVLFALPDGPEDRPVDVHWSAPDGWMVSTSISQGIQKVARLGGGTFLAAREARTSTRRVGTATVTITALDGARDVERIADALAHAVADVVPPPTRHDYTFNIIDFDGKSPGLSMTTSPFGGTVYLTPGVPDDAWLPWLLAAATLPGQTPGDPATAWYAEGFATYRTVSELFAKGYLPPVAFARMIDQAATGYGNSPFRRAPQGQVEDSFARSRDMRELPANRGLLFAALLDARIRAATGGRKTLLDALARMGSPAAPGPALIDAVAAIGAGDIAPLYRRYIVEGQLLQLPRDTLGPCFTVGTVADWSGWQVQHVFAKRSCELRGAAVASP